MQKDDDLLQVLYADVDVRQLAADEIKKLRKERDGLRRAFGYLISRVHGLANTDRSAPIREELYLATQEGEHFLKGGEAAVDALIEERRERSTPAFTLTHLQDLATGEGRSIKVRRRCWDKDDWVQVTHWERLGVVITFHGKTKAGNAWSEQEKGDSDYVRAEDKA